MNHGLLRECYKREKDRLETFHCWPVDSPVRKEDLAKNGFYYLHRDDIVKCHFCGLQLKDWNVGDIVEEEHRRYKPLCPLLLGIPVGNVPLNQNDAFEWKIPRETLMYPAFDTYEKRFISFDDWPPGLIQKPEDLTKAGFFYKGRGDIVQCFCCGGILRRWEPDDIPCEEHRKHFPACMFIQQFFQHHQDFDSSVHKQNLLSHAKMMGFQDTVEQYCRHIPPHDLSNICDINHLLDELEKFRQKPEFQSKDEIDGEDTSCNHCRKENVTLTYGCSHGVCDDCAAHEDKSACGTCSENVRQIYQRQKPSTCN